MIWDWTVKKKFRNIRSLKRMRRSMITHLPIINQLLTAIFYHNLAKRLAFNSMFSFQRSLVAALLKRIMKMKTIFWGVNTLSSKGIFGEKSHTLSIYFRWKIFHMMKMKQTKVIPTKWTSTRIMRMLESSTKIALKLTSRPKRSIKS